MLLIDQIAASPERMKRLQRARLEMEVTDLICQLMDQQNVTRAELARRLGKSRPYVTKLLAEGQNMTLNTASDIFFALGRSLRVIDRPISARSPRLLVVEVAQMTRQAPPTSRKAVPIENFRFARTTAAKAGAAGRAPKIGVFQAEAV